MSHEIVTKTGKKLKMREPENGDAPALLEYINELVEENTMIMLNEKKGLEEEEEYVRKSVEEIKVGKKVQLLVVDGEERVLANAEVKKGVYKAEHVGVLGISVHKSIRREGVGEIVARELIRRAKTGLGLKMIRLDVFADNVAARGLYKKLGFVETGIVPGGLMQDDKRVDNVVMCLELE